jgi:hypothetical protein
MTFSNAVPSSENCVSPHTKGSLLREAYSSRSFTSYFLNTVWKIADLSISKSNRPVPLHYMRLLILLLSLLVALPTSAQRLIPYRRGLLWGYADSTRHVAIPPQYQYAEPFKGGLGKVWRAGKCGYINTQGREVVPICWDAASYLQEKIPWVYGGSLGTAWPYVKNWVVVMQFDSAIARRYSFQPPAKPWLDWEGEEARGYSASHAQLLGFYTPAGRQVLPARYASFYALNAQCFVATRVVSRYDGTEVGGCIIQDFVDRPIYGHQLVTYAGRILAGGQTFSQINGLYGDTLLVGAS